MEPEEVSDFMARTNNGDDVALFIQRLNWNGRHLAHRCCAIHQQIFDSLKMVDFKDKNIHMAKQCNIQGLKFLTTTATLDRGLSESSYRTLCLGPDPTTQCRKHRKFKPALLVTVVDVIALVIGVASVSVIVTLRYCWSCIGFVACWWHGRCHCYCPLLLMLSLMV